MVPLTAPLFGGLLLGGHISQKRELLLLKMYFLVKLFLLLSSFKVFHFFFEFI
jgi:hypothetical protein